MAIVGANTPALPPEPIVRDVAIIFSTTTPSMIQIGNSKEKLGPQLSHCLWSVLVLANMYNIDLEQSFMETMDKLENHLLETQE